MPVLPRGKNKDITTADVYDLLAGTVTPEELRVRRQARRERRARVLAMLATVLIIAATLYGLLVCVSPDTSPFVWVGIFAVGTFAGATTLVLALGNSGRTHIT